MPIAVFTRLFQALGFWGQDEKSDFQERISLTIVKLEELEFKIGEIEHRLEDRATQLFRKTVMLLRRGERSQAAIYAGEISQIRNVIKLIKAVRNLITMTKERLTTVRDMNELSEVLMVFGAALEGVKDMVARIQPNMSLVFDEISKSVHNLVVETSVDHVANIDPTVISTAAMEVLNEALKEAEERVKEEFPEPPVAPVIPAQATAKAAALAAAAPAAGGAVVQQPASAAATSTAVRERSIEEVEELVLRYIREHNGYLDIRDFTTRYQVDRGTVLQALHRLAEKGLIRIH